MSARPSQSLAFPRDALLAAAAFGISTPLAKYLLTDISPFLLAGLLYLGSGIGLSLWLALQPRSGSREAPLTRTDLPWMAGAVLAGGILAPLLLMLGLQTTSAAGASLLLNLEIVFTVLLAWFALHEGFDRRTVWGIVFIIAGTAVLSWPHHGLAGWNRGAAMVIGACLCWGIDNNLTQKVSAKDPLQIARLKGLVAGGFNLALGIVRGGLHGNALPTAGAGAGAAVRAATGTGTGAAPGVGALTGTIEGAIAAALVVGLVGYGLSLSLFVRSLRAMGTARTMAYFALAPFIGTLASLALLHERATWSLGGAAAFMGLGTILHLSERHEHRHRHEALAHAHAHTHDEHHQHEHGPGTEAGEPHAHDHVHQPHTHGHRHYPDLHHRHGHEEQP